MVTETTEIGQSTKDEIWYGMLIGAFAMFVVTISLGLISAFGGMILAQFGLEDGFLIEASKYIGFSFLLFGWTQLLYVPALGFRRRRLGKPREAIGVWLTSGLGVMITCWVYVWYLAAMASKVAA